MTLRSRLARDLFLKLCGRIRVGSIQVTTPDGRVHLFEGERAPEVRAEIEVADDTLFGAVLTQGDWGLGWGYVERKWEAKDPGQIARVFMLNEEVFRPWVRLGHRISPRMRRVLATNRADLSPERSVRQRTVGQAYDVGNDFFQWMLGPSMVFTCAIWPHADASLEQAQENKLRLVVEKARIEPGHRVLDLGCGWGSLAGFIRRHTGAARVRGVALSRAQIDWAKQHHPGCEFAYRDYASVGGRWDRIVSVGLAEHVGRRNFGAFLRGVCDRLEPGGRFVMHTMQSHEGVLMESRRDRWVSFGSVTMPNGDVPSNVDIVRAALSTGRLRILHTESFGLHYARTGQAWLENLVAHREEVIAAYSEAFYRTWVYSLALGSAAMETGMTLAHVVFEKKPYGSSTTDSIL
jgi:cyclopropane-fatty-acyl-phospholipid synthase